MLACTTAKATVACQPLSVRRCLPPWTVLTATMTCASATPNTQRTLQVTDSVFAKRGSFCNALDINVHHNLFHSMWFARLYNVECSMIIDTLIKIVRVEWTHCCSKVPDTVGSFADIRYMFFVADITDNPVNMSEACGTQFEKSESVHSITWDAWLEEHVTIFTLL